MIPLQIHVWTGEGFELKPATDVRIGDVITANNSVATFYVLGRTFVRDEEGQPRPLLNLSPAGTLFHPAWRHGQYDP